MPFEEGVGRFLGGVVRFDVGVAVGSGAAATFLDSCLVFDARGVPPAGGEVPLGLREHAAAAVSLGEFASVLAGALRLAAEGFVVTVKAPCDVRLLPDAQHRLGHVVDDEAGEEEDLEHRERHGQVLHDLLLGGRHRRAHRGRAATIRC